MKHKDFEATFILKDKENLSEVNVGNTYTVISVNRKTREVKLNRYSKEEWKNPNKLITAEWFLKLIGNK